MLRAILKSNPCTPWCAWITFWYTYVELHRAKCNPCTAAVQGLHFGTLCVQWLDVLGVSNTLSLIHYYIRNAEHVQLLMGFSGVPHCSDYGNNH